MSPMWKNIYTSCYVQNRLREENSRYSLKIHKYSLKTLTKHLLVKINNFFYYLSTFFFLLMGSYFKLTFTNKINSFLQKKKST